MLNKTGEQKSGDERLLPALLAAVCIMISLVCAQSAFAAAPNPGHDASQISGGTFSSNDGDFIFPASVNLTVSSGDIIGAGGVKLDLGEQTAAGIYIYDDAGSGYPDIYCNNGASNTYCEFRSGLFVNSGTLIATNAMYARGGIRDDSAADPLQLNDNVTVIDNLAVDTSTFFVDSYTDKVGIGDSTPGEKLEVAGNINSTGGDICITGGNCLSTAGTGSMTSWIIAGDDDSSTVSDGETVTIAGSGTIDTAQNAKTITVSVQANSIDDAQVVDNGLDATSLAADSVSDSELDGGFGWTLDTDLNIDSNTLVVSYDDDKVGIGTADPAGVLNVVKSGSGVAVNSSITGDATGNVTAYTGYAKTTKNYNAARGMYASTNTTGTAAHAYGIETDSHTTGTNANAYGIYAKAYASSGSTYAVYGKNDNNNNIYGYLGGGFYGVYGQYDSSTYGYLGDSVAGVYGHATGADYGVYGSNSGATAIRSYGALKVEYGGVCVDTGLCNTPADGNVEIEDGSMCIGNAGCTAPTGDGNLAIEGNLTKTSLSDLYIRTYNGKDIVFGDSSHDNDIEIGNGGLCMDSDGSCAPPADGNIVISGTLTQSTSSDIAEVFPSREPVTQTESGTVMVIDGSADKLLTVSYKPFDSKVAGIVSTDPGIVLGGDLVNRDNLSERYGLDIALAGRVPVKVIDENGPIKAGDFLTTSSKPGYAMKWNLLEPEDAKDFEELKKIISENERRRNAILGKAFEPLDSTKGQIIALITLQ